MFFQYEVPCGAFEHKAFPRLGAAKPALTIIELSRWLGIVSAAG